MSAIHKRLTTLRRSNLSFYRCLNSCPLPYEVFKATPDIKQSDFDSRIDVLPFDPNIFSMSQRIALAQTQLQLVQSNPEIHAVHRYQAYRKMYEALGVTKHRFWSCQGRHSPSQRTCVKIKKYRNQRLQAFHQIIRLIEAHPAMLSTPIAQPMRISL